MTKDTRDAKIEHQELIISQLLEDSATLKQTVIKLTQERDEALIEKSLSKIGIAVSANCKNSTTIDANLIKSQELVNNLLELIDNYSYELEKPFKKEFIKGIDVKTFIRDENKETLARSAILAYANQIGLKKQFAYNPDLMEEALNYWFGRPFHEYEIKKLTTLKAKEFMSPHNRAKRSADYAIRKAKTQEYEFEKV